MKYFKLALPHLLSILGGALLVIMFFSPLFFENKVLDQFDTVQGVSAGNEIKDFRTDTGEEALWTNSMFSGMPAYLINISYSGELVKYIHQIISLGMPSSAQVIFLSFLCFYILLISFGVRPLFAFGGAIAYSFNTFSLVSVEAGHIWKVRAIAYMPLVVAGVHLVFSKPKKWLGLGVLSVAVALQIYSNHLQMTYYLLLMLVIYGITKTIEAAREKTWPAYSKSVAILLIAAFLGVGANSARLWTTLEYSKYSTRGKSELANDSAGQASTSGLDRDYVFNWSYGVMESFTLLMPNFSGGASSMTLDDDSNLGKALQSRGASPAQMKDQLKSVPTYWGNQPITAGPSYAGAVMLFLVVLSFFFVDRTIRVWLISASLLGLMLSWGKNFESFNYFMYDYFPAYSKFRSVSFAMMILLLSVPLLGTLSLEKYVTSEDPKKLKKLLISAGVVAGICLLFAIFANAFSYRGLIDDRLTQLPDWYVSAIRLDRKSMLMGDAFRGVIFISLAVGIIYAFQRGKINSLIAGLLFIGLSMADFIPVGKRFFHEEKYIKGVGLASISPSESDKQIKTLAKDDHYRVLNLQNPFSEAYTSAFHSSLGGYHGAKMQRYQELVESHLSPTLSEMVTMLRNGSVDFGDAQVVNMLNAEYIKYGPGRDNVLVNQSSFGNAWLVNTIVKVNSADEEISALGEVDLKRTAVLNEQKFKGTLDQYQGTGSITLANYAPNEMTYVVNTEGLSFAVFSEIYYLEGWTAKIDGEEADIKQVNYVLRGLEVPNGAQEIVFTFNPASYRVGNILSLLFSLLMLGTFGFGVVQELRKP
ncbi:MAG: hypothetical protein ACI8QD_000936 [Cyclobacteriaceae bacterium]|jgi:hypothetical protein